VSNDHDGVDGGREPAESAASDEAAAQASDGSATADSADAADQPRKAGDAELTPAAGTEEDGSTETATTPGAVSAGSARAAARRSAARAGVSESKGEATQKRAAATTVKRPNVFVRFGRFLREVVAELRKVIWPTRNQMVTYTIVVIVFVVFMVALVGVLDLLFAKGVLAVFG
jgi:preprotein translocase subunit SecE